MENKKKLTVAQERHKAFAEEYLANGMNGLQAYKKVYPKVNDDTAKSNATKLLTNTYVQSILSTQKEKTATKLEITKESLIKVLMGIMNDVETRPQDRINSVKTINQMLGYNAVEKKEVEHKGGIIWNEEKSYD